MYVTDVESKRPGSKMSASFFTWIVRRWLDAYVSALSDLRMLDAGASIAYRVLVVREADSQ